MKLFDLFKKSNNTTPASDTLINNCLQNNVSEETNKPTINKGTSGLFEIVIPYFDVFDKRFPKYGVPVSVQASVSYVIRDLEQYQTICKTTDGCPKNIKETISPLIEGHLKNSVINAPSRHNIPIDAIKGHLIDISSDVMAQVSSMIQDLYGITILMITITDLLIDTESDNYLYLNSLTEDMTTEKRVIAHNMEISNMKLQHEFDQSNFRLQNESQQNIFKTKGELEIDALKREHEINLGGKEKLQSIQLENQKETMRIQREEMQRAAKLQTEQTFIDAHRVDCDMELEQRKLEHIQALEKLHIEEKTSESKEMPIVDDYLVAVNQEPVGPFNWEQLKSLVAQGCLTRQTYVWKQGMPEWLFAGDVIELSGLFDEK